MNERQEKRCKVYVVSVDEIPAQTDMKVLMDHIDPEHLTRIRRFRRQEDFLRSLYGEVLVRHGVSGYPDTAYCKEQAVLPGYSAVEVQHFSRRRLGGGLRVPF